MSMILATTWVGRGVAAQYPTKYEVDDAELGRISKIIRLQLDDAREDLKQAEKAEKGEDIVQNGDNDTTREQITVEGHAQPDATDADDLKEYDLDDYDEDPAETAPEQFGLFGNVGSLAYHAPHEEDPYLVLPEAQAESDDEREELQILPTDNLLLAAKVEDEVAHLEVMVYEDQSDSLYVHHDMMLQAVPLCVEWIDIPVGPQAGKSENGNYVAVGTMDPLIEIFNLDVVDNMFPDAILGEGPQDMLGTDSTKAKKKKRKKANDQYHVDAVLTLAANRQHRNLLASGSADTTVKLWDLKSTKCMKSYSMHEDKVCSLDWNPTEATVLLSGANARKVIASDMRAPAAKAPTWTVDSDVEKVRWNIHDSHFFYVTTENGTVYYYDTRNPPPENGRATPIWTLQAHDRAVSSFDINPVVPNYLVTGSEDKMVKLWNVADNKPAMVVSRNLDVGRVFATQFAPDPEVAFTLSVAGSKGRIQLWDTSTNAAVRNVFAPRVKLPERSKGERIIATNDDTGDEEDEQEEGGVRTTPDDAGESMDED